MGNDILSKALRVVEKGVPIFPCNKDKRPLCEHGFKDATTNAWQIKVWWKKWPSAHYGIPTGQITKLLVVDVDVKNHVDGNEALWELQEKHGNLPDTVEVLSPSGGRHLYFTIPGNIETKNTVGLLGDGLDTRGDGGYVLGAGNIGYDKEASSPTSPAVAPDWLISLLQSKPIAPKSNGSGGPVIHDGSRNNQLFALASSLRRRGLSVTAIEAALAAENVERCNPPLPEEEILKISRSVGKYEQGKVVELVPQNKKKEEGQEDKKRDFPFWVSGDLEVIDSTEYLIDGWLEASTVNVLYAPKDTYKSFVALSMACCIGSGRAWYGHATRKSGIVYIAGEGNRGYKRRLRAWCIRNRVKLSELPIAVSDRPTRILDPETLSDWCVHLETLKMRFEVDHLFVVIDTLSTNMGPGDENRPTDMAQLISSVRISFAASLGATVLFVHHTGKNVDLGARGGSSLEGNADNVLVLRSGPEEGLVEVHCKHTKDDERPLPVSLQTAPVELGIVDNKGQSVTSLVLDIYLTERQQTIVHEVKNGRSQRGMATLLKCDKKIIGREIRKLRDLGLVT